MKKILIVSLLTLMPFSALIRTANASGINFDMLKATPVGSWQVREDIETKAKGKTTGITMRTSMLGSEQRNGETHYWIEASIDSFKITKKNKRKPKGKRTIVKVLIPESLFKSNGENILANLSGFGVETIIQSGKERPMRINSTGGVISGMMKALGTQITHDYVDQGSEPVTVAAGDFNAQKISGAGTAEMNLVFKKVKVESNSTSWIADNVPFGFVRGETTTITNGKTSNTSSQLLDFGMSGAKSELIGEPLDLPEGPDFGGVFK